MLTYGCPLDHAGTFREDLLLINPRRACAARVTVLGSVCLSVTLHLTSRVFFRLTKDATYRTGDEGQNICGIFSETAPLQS